jgi:hypothetical protein
MASGFFLGGVASGYQKQSEINNAADFNQKRLQLAQQAEQNAQQRDMHVRIDKIAADAWGHIEDTVNAFKNAGHSSAEAAQAITPLLNNLIQLKTSAGMPDAQAIYTAQFSTLLAGPSQAQNVRTLEQAKDPYKSQIESLTLQEKQQELETQKQNATLSGLTATPGQATPTQPGQQSSNPQDAGEQFLNRLPNDVLRQQVKNLAEYRINPNTFSTRTTKGMTQSQRQIMTGLAEQYAAARGEQFDQTQFAGRNKAVSSFSAGPVANTVRSFNVLVSHLDVLKDAADALNNGDTQAFNRVKNLVSSATGNPAPTNFDAVKGIVADEINKAVLGGAGALGDRDKINATVQGANSPAQLLGVIRQYQHLSAGQLHGLQTQYESTTGLTDFGKFLDKRTKQFFGTDAGTDQSGKDVGRVPVSVGGFTFTPSGQ